MSRRIVHTYGRKARTALVDSTLTPSSAQSADVFPPDQGPQASPAETELEAKARNHNKLVKALTDIGRSPSQRRSRSLFRKTVVFDESIDDDDDVDESRSTLATTSGKGAREQHDDVVTTHCDFSTTQSALELVESGNTQAKLDNLLYIMEGFDSDKASILVASAKLLAEACRDRGNRCVVRALFGQRECFCLFAVASGCKHFLSMIRSTTAVVGVVIFVQERPSQADTGATTSVFEACTRLCAKLVQCHAFSRIIAARGSCDCILFFSLHHTP